MSYIDILIRLHSADHRILMNRAAVKGRTVSELAGEVLSAGIRNRATEARESAWDEYRTRCRIDADQVGVVRAAFIAGWENSHGRVEKPARRPRPTDTPEPAGTIAATTRGNSSVRTAAHTPRPAPVR
jgi:hypothetical protein